MAHAIRSEPDVQQIDRYILQDVRMLARDYPQVDQRDLYNEARGIKFVGADNGARRWMEALGGAGPITKRLMDTARQLSQHLPAGIADGGYRKK